MPNHRLFITKPVRCLLIYFLNFKLQEFIDSSFVEVSPPLCVLQLLKEDRFFITNDFISSPVLAIDCLDFSEGRDLRAGQLY